MNNYSRMYKLTVFCSLIFALASFLHATDSMTSHSTSTVVYYIPFQVETYIPVTPETIVDQAWEKWSISEERGRSRLFAILSHGHGSAFDKNRVRALVIAGEKRYLIDTNGVVLSKSKESQGTVIDKKAFMEFRDSLRADQRQVLRREK